RRWLHCMVAPCSAGRTGTGRPTHAGPLRGGRCGRSKVIGKDLAIVADDQVRQRLQIDRKRDPADAAVTEDELADAGVRAAKAAVGQGAVLVLPRPQGPLVGTVDAGHAADGVVLAAEEAAVLVLAAQGIGTDVLFAEHERVGGAVNDAAEV